MKCLILANGDYGDLEKYSKDIMKADVVLCADGGANYAYLLNIVPDYIIGDMDSINSKVKDFFLEKEVGFKKFPKKKDFTDIQLVVSLAEDLGANRILFLGTQGKRLDHTLSSIYSSMGASINAKEVTHYSPDCTVHIVSNHLKLAGNIGDIVSVLALTDEVNGLSHWGLEYPLDNVQLQKSNPYAISNILIANEAEIQIAHGIIAVLHYHDIAEI
ncbi:MAG TPA: thiamine diphosphokinase [Syntrophomonadaceae bacterium]|nr:thiamine diphosphokinase [Syntrophomonadaceae bacterium]